MIQAAYPKLGYKSPFVVISRDWPVDFDEKNSQNYDLQAFNPCGVSSNNPVRGLRMRIHIRVLKTLQEYDFSVISLDIQKV